MFKRQQKNISYGIIAFKIVDNKPQYCMVCRKDSFSYSEFLRSKYELEDVDSIYRILKFMTKDEQNKLLTKDFESMWDELWVLDKKKIHSGKFKKEFNNSKYKFETLRRGYMTTIHTDLGVKYKKHIKLETILKEFEDSKQDIYLEPEWGFPKGKKNENEGDFDCAKREFFEETNIQLNNLKFLNHPPIVEKFLADNLQEYTHIYYLAQCPEGLNLNIDKENYNQISEISQLSWFTYEEAHNKIRDYNKEKKEVLDLVDKLIHDMITNKKNI